jgi:hypothetical protein
MLEFIGFFLFAAHRSLLTVILGVVILNLALFAPCSATMALPGAGTAQQNIPPKTGQTTSSPPLVQSSVENILIDRIEDDAIYSRDGRKFEIGGAKVIDNSRNATGTKQAELFYENGSLVQVILK